MIGSLIDLTLLISIVEVLCHMGDSLSIELARRSRNNQVVLSLSMIARLATFYLILGFDFQQIHSLPFQIAISAVMSS